MNVFESIAEQLVVYLKDRKHPEKPHIAVLGPLPFALYEKFLEDYKLLDDSNKVVSVDEEEAEETEEEDEGLSKSFHAWYLTGFEFSKISPLTSHKERKVNLGYSFAIRLAPPCPDDTEENFADVKIEFTLINENIIDVTVKINRKDINSVFQKNLRRQISWNNNNRVDIAVGLPLGSKIYARLEHSQGNHLFIDLKDSFPDIEKYLGSRQDKDFKFSINKTAAKNGQVSSRDTKYITLP
ncbi:hypothetical protein N186_03705 [Thermofilum adornatum]|uniref:Uncharacterized protein n=1 Tax=Thermofilum adornatum TaxID=1365176 RepID=S5ZDM1_9CREN|nr:hypothetical protein [Thermofilum adornatum]AGT35103.1 hypothetical protein N186_03705 [Thermofilum adornatum]